MSASSREQETEATKSAKTMAKPDPFETFRMSSTGSSDTIENATVPELVMTPIKFHKPDQTTATCGSREWV